MQKIASYKLTSFHCCGKVLTLRCRIDMDRHNREFREIRKRARRCDRGLKPHPPLAKWLGRRGEWLIRESEDLPQSSLMTFAEQRSIACICGEIRAPGSIFWFRAFFCLVNLQPAPWEEPMLKNELAFTKQALLATKDWDTYQAILRRCLVLRSAPTKK